ncbi:MAG: phage holin family protein [Thermomicrobiales bacterium]
MIKLVINVVVTLLANAIALLAAAWLLEDFEINASSFIIAVAIFTAATVILGPLVIKIAMTSATFLMGGIALVTTLVGLIIADVLSDGFSIRGIGTWIAATVIIWFASVLASLALPWIILKAGIGATRDAAGQSPSRIPPRATLK